VTHFLPDFIRDHGYIAVFLLMWIETLLPIFPSELVMPLSGLIASQGKLWLPGVILSGAAGSLTGAISWYWAARALGFERFERLVTRYGRITTVSAHEVAVLQRWFERFGSILVLVGRVTAIVAIIIAIFAARPLVGASEQAFQFIQEFTGFFTPGITIIFLLGLFWKRANEAGAFTAAVASVLLSWVFKLTWASLPFMDRMGVVFLISLALAVVVSLVTPQRAGADTIDTKNVSYKTSTGFNVGALGVVLILVALYATYW